MSGKLIILLFFISCSLFSQKSDETSSFLDVNYFYGTILRHNKDISHLVKGHPEGLILSYNRKTFGDKRWQQAYNHPDWGFSFLYQNPHNLRERTASGSINISRIQPRICGPEYQFSLRADVMAGASVKISKVC